MTRRASILRLAATPKKAEVLLASFYRLSGRGVAKVGTL